MPGDVVRIDAKLPVAERIVRILRNGPQRPLDIAVQVDTTPRMGRSMLLKLEGAWVVQRGNKWYVK